MKEGINNIKGGRNKTFYDYFSNIKINTDSMLNILDNAVAEKEKDEFKVDNKVEAKYIEKLALVVDYFREAVRADYELYNRLVEIIYSKYQKKYNKEGCIKEKQKKRRQNAG